MSNNSCKYEEAKIQIQNNIDQIIEEEGQGSGSDPNSNEN